MGMGAASAQQDQTMQVVKRSNLAATLPVENSHIDKKTLRACIPEDCFKRSYMHSLAHLVLDCAQVVATWYLAQYLSERVPTVATPLVWLAYWFYQGLTMTGLWVIAHECGHGGFTDSRLLNDTVGFMLHSSMLTPYFSWALTHAKHHHYTNHMTMGETWVPATADPKKRTVIAASTTLGSLKRIALIFLAGWYVYLFTNATGAKQNKGQSHFSPSSKALFKTKDRPYVIASNIGMLLTLGVVAASVHVWGFLAVWRTYLVPLWITNFYLAAITFMQHTHPDVPHFQSNEWTWLRGALSTIDRSMGPFVDWKLHHIVDSHVVHHTFSDMPFYGAKKATPYVKEHLGIYYKSCMGSKVLGSEYLGYWRDFFYCTKAAVTVGKEPGEQGFMWFQ